MNCNLTFLLIVIINCTQIFGDVLRKCCGNSQQIVDYNSTLICRANSNKRVQSFFENDNFLKGNASGTCIETIHENKTALFLVDDRKNISKKEDLAVEYFPKCCHLGRSYDPKLHSCSKTQTPTSIEKHIPKNSFLFIGLPRCKVIFDVEVSNMENLSWPSNFIYLPQENRNISKGNFCTDSTVDSKFVVRICEEDFQICEEIRCFHKCCFDGQSFVNGSFCKDTFRYGVDLHASKHIEDPEAPFAIIHGIKKPLQLLKENMKFNIDRFGIFTSYILMTDSYAHYPVITDSYCMEYAYKKGPRNYTLDNYSLFRKIMQQRPDMKFSVARWVKILSCIFLFLTILVYVILPKLRNLFGKVLLSYCVATFIIFFLLTISQFFHNDFSDDFCKTMGFLLVLSSFWSFTWMHIMCIDIWFSFASPRTLSGPLQRNELKRLLQYSIYGWGLPILWILVLIFFNTTNLLPSSLHPHVGELKCFLENYDDRRGNYAFTFFVTIPMVIQQTVNIIFFIKTIIYCIKIKSEIRKMNDNNRSQNDYNAGKEKLHLILKLAIVMGMSFIFETISSVRNFNLNPVTEYIEIVWDTINCLQGLFIFIIFIWKKKIYNDLCEKFKILRGFSLTSSSTPESMQSSCTKEETINLEERISNITNKCKRSKTIAT